MTVKLDETNYLEWSQYAKLFLSGNGNLGYINGKITEPKETDPSYEKWETEKLAVMSLLLHSMQPSISRGIMFPQTARKIWDLVHQTYSQNKYVTQVYQLRQKTSHLR
ncbi:hypothetical protein AMTRI_Chr04g250420 [Amborella trichopoda]